MTHILTTHVGSLPRSQQVVDFLFARERGEACDAAAFDAAMAEAVDETVGRQVAANVGIVSDGETSKISYATYVKDRYTGFSGDSPRNAPADLKLFPSFLQRLANDGGTPQYARPMCTGEVKPKGQGELGKDIANLKAAMAKHGAKRGFMNAASPGVISLFLPNQHYKNRESYLAALADGTADEDDRMIVALALLFRPKMDREHCTGSGRAAVRCALDADLGVTITVGGPTPTTLAGTAIPRTGSSSTEPLVRTGAVLVVAGGVLLFAVRRRQQATVGS